MSEKVKAVTAFIDENEDGLSYLIRINNLAKDTGVDLVKADLLQTDLERSFYETISNIDEIALVNAADYKKELENIQATALVGNEYLDKTMINDENEEIKNNRLAMLNQVQKRIARIFDISQIVR